MNWSAHFFIGIVAGCLVAFLSNADIASSIQYIIICAFSALVPDIDHQDSKIRQIGNYAALAFALLFSIFLNCGAVSCIFHSWLGIIVLSLAIFGAYQLFVVFFMPSHRGVVHSLAAAAAYAILLLLLAGAQFALFGLAGYISHLLADREVKIA